MEIGGNTHVHGLYVIGIGYFWTIAVEGDEPRYRIAGCIGPERLFKFTADFRNSFDRWGSRPPGMSAHVQAYLPDQSSVLAE
jgi:hypothetical protein